MGCRAAALSDAALWGTAPDLSLDRSQVGIMTIGHQVRVFRATRPFVIYTAVSALFVTSLLVAHLGVTAALPAYLYFTVVGILLAAIDATTGRLPDRLTLPSYPVLVILLSGAEATSANQGSTVRAAAAAALLTASFLASAFVGGLGLGDVKLAGLLGLVLGFRSWTMVYTGMLAAFVLAAIFVLFRVIQGQSPERIPLGPFLVAGTMVAVLL